MRLKKTITGLMLLCAMLSIKVNAQWADVGNAGFTAGSTSFSSMAITSTDTIYIAFRDGANSDRATVMKFNGTNWTIVGSAGFSAGIASYISLAFDSNDTAYIAFEDGGNSDKATVMKFNGTSWVNVGSAGFTASTADYLSLAFDSNDTAYLAFTDGNTSSQLSVMKFNGTSWNSVGSAGISTGGAFFISLAFDSNDQPYVSYRDDGNSQKASVVTYSGGSWSNVGTAGFSGAAGSYTSLAINSNDQVYVAFEDGANSDKATVMTYNGSNWSVVGTAGFSSGQARFHSLKFDSNDILHDAFQDVGTSNKSRLMKYNGSSWIEVGSSGLSGGSTAYTTSVFDSDNIPYVGYEDGSNSSEATVRKYTYNVWNGSIWSEGTPDSTSEVIIASTTAPATFSCLNLTINDGQSLNTGTSNTVTVYGELTNGGNGISGSGTVSFTENGTTTLRGDTLNCSAGIVAESGCTLATGSMLRLTSDASNTGRIGNSAGTISGNVIAQRYNTGKRAFRFYGHPFSSSIALSQLTDEIDITGTGGAANGFTTTQTNNPSAFWFDVTAADTSTSGANPGWTAFTSATSADWDQYELLRLLVRGAKGEGLSGGTYSPTAATFEAAGAVNQGTQVITLTKGSNTEFVGCGNPFPSPVQMNTVAQGTNVGNTYYAWDATSGAAGAYVTNTWAVSYVLPAYSAFFTTVSANTNNTLTFEEADKDSGGAGLFKGTANENYIELIISDSTTKWDRLLINLDDNSMAVQDKLDGKKLYNPGLDFFTLSKDDVRLAVDVRPYDDGQSIPLGLTAYNRYNKYVIRTGMFDIPAGTKLILHDKYANTKHELKAGFEYWFDVTSDSLSQGNDRFEINMVGKPSGIIEASQAAQMFLIPNPAHNEVKVSFEQLEGDVQVQLISVTGQVVYKTTADAQTGNVTVPLHNVANGIYIVELQSSNARFTQKLIKN